MIVPSGGWLSFAALVCGVVSVLLFTAVILALEARMHGLAGCG